jgi:solute carrier family 31 (copper transporter), member 1
MREVATRVLLLVLVAQSVFALVAADMSMTTMPMGDSTPANQPACVSNSSATSCVSYTYPNANAYADLNNLCTAMSFMPGCSIYSACNLTNNALSPDTACEPFQLLTTICKLDTGMSMMSGCANYNSLCANTSVVRQCSSVSGLAFLPTTQQVNSDVKSICSDMTMDGCERCTPDWEKGKTFSTCNLLDVYGYLCYTMPDMRQCVSGTSWDSLCSTSSPGKPLYLCKGQMMSPASLFSSNATSSSNGSSSSNSNGASSKFKPGPVMKMYFFTDTPFYLLFKSWTPSTSAGYTGAWFAVFALGIVYEMLHMFRSWFERYWLSKTAESVRDVEVGCDCAHQGSAKDGTPAIGDPPGKTKPMGASLASVKEASLLWLGQDLMRAMLVFLSAGLANILMLAVMSFNVGILFAATGGLAFGTLVFGRFHGRGSHAYSDTRACCTG